jgi:hypothetical protein
VVGRGIETVSNGLIGKEAWDGDSVGGRAAVGFPSEKKGLSLWNLGKYSMYHIPGSNKVDDDQSIKLARCLT